MNIINSTVPCAMAGQKLSSSVTEIAMELEQNQNVVEHVTMV
jgi:hypothetical protein